MSDESHEKDDSPQKASVWTVVILAFTVALIIGLFGGYMFSSLGSALFGEQQEPGLDNPGSIEQRADQLVGEPVPSPPIADTTPVAGEPVPLDEPVSEVAAPTEVSGQRERERRTLAYESPLTPPVADIASRIQQRRVSPPEQRRVSPQASPGGSAALPRAASLCLPCATPRSPPLQREEEQQAAAEAARLDRLTSDPEGFPAVQGSSDEAPSPAGVLTNAAFGPHVAVTVGKQSDAVPGRATKSPVRTPAVPRHELYRGSVIPAVLESAIDSDLPGLVRARTTRNVYDSRTGTHLLIPRGSRLIGVYGQGAAGGQGAGGGQRRLFFAWQEMRLPDGTPVALDNFSALGADGASGIKARRATGFLEALGAAVLFDLAGNATAILTAATGIGQQQSETGALANAISGALGNSTQRVGADYVGSLLAGRPRFRVKAGSFMNVIIERDLMLPAVGRTKATR